MKQELIGISAIGVGLIIILFVAALLPMPPQPPVIGDQPILIPGPVPTPPVSTYTPSGTQVDDWVFGGTGVLDDVASGVTGIVGPLGVFGGMATKQPAPSMMAESAPGGNIGFSVGGAKDINNFRENIINGYLPIHTDVTYEGLFYDYYFDTGEVEACHNLFCPSYTYAVSEDPFSGDEDYYMTVGLNSGIKESDFERKKLNLIVVMDVSGSMGSAFDSYYYDDPEKWDQGGDEQKTKMEIANEATVLLLDHLEDDDRFGMVLFDNDAYLAKPLGYVGDTDMDAIKGHIMDIREDGGTYMESGMKLGTSLFNEIKDIDKELYENRIIFLTDAQPNIGELSREGLAKMVSDNSADGIYTSFIGIGVDFNTELIELMTKTRGANYYSVHSAKEFKEQMDEGFDYMVTPLVFDLELKLDANGYDIEKVYGSPEADEATGEIMKVNTLFPSRKVDGETRGGVVLVKLKKTSAYGDIKLSVKYKDRSMQEFTDTKEVIFRDREWSNTGIRKAVVLSRYADLAKGWIVYERGVLTHKDDWVPTPMPFCITHEMGIMPSCGVYDLGPWERQSSPLVASEHYKDLFKEFAVHFEDEMDAIGDDEMQQELDLIELVLKADGTVPDDDWDDDWYY